MIFRDRCTRITQEKRIFRVITWLITVVYFAPGCITKVNYAAHQTCSRSGLSFKFNMNKSTSYWPINPLERNNITVPRRSHRAQCGSREEGSRVQTPSEPFVFHWRFFFSLICLRFLSWKISVLYNCHLLAAQWHRLVDTYPEQMSCDAALHPLH